MSSLDIVILGTSLSIGAGLANSYAHDLVPFMEHGKTGRVRVHNFSKDGAQSSQGLIEYPKACALKPRVALIEYQMNDCLVSQATSRSRTLSIINGFKALSPGTLIRLVTTNPTFSEASSEAAARTFVNNYYQIYRDLAVSENVGLIDGYYAWSGAALSEIPDGVHPTVAAHRARTVPFIAAALSNLLT